MGQKPGVQTLAETPLARMRVQRGLTQAGLAERADISVSTYRRLERGQAAKPPAAYLVRLAGALGCPLEELLGEPGSPTAPGSIASGSENPTASGTEVNSQSMGRARGSQTTHAVSTRGRRLDLTGSEQRLVDAAIDGDTKPFLDRFLSGRRQALALLDDGVVEAVAFRVMIQTRATHEQQHAQTLRDIVGDDEQRIRGILDMAAELATADLVRSFVWLANAQEVPSTRAIRPIPQDLAQHAEQLLDNRVRQACGESPDTSLRFGAWRVLGML